MRRLNDFEEQLKGYDNLDFSGLSDLDTIYLSSVPRYPKKGDSREALPYILIFGVMSYP
jgi:hypothetical protein